MREMRRRFAYIGAILIALLLAAGDAPAQERDRRVALVIGNADYRKLTDLKNPTNDAADTASALRNVGFQVTTVIDGSQEDMENAIRAFGSELARSDVGMFYYSGHGVQSGGRNYLIPIDADVRAEHELRYKAVDADFVLDYMNRGGSRLNIMILDACRDNPFSIFKGASKGLAVIAAPSGSIIVYATSPGATAEDGTGRNSPFTAALVRHLGVPGLDVMQLFDRVGQQVKSSTSGRQIPWILKSYYEPYPLTRQLGGAVGSIRIEGNTAGRIFLDDMDKGALVAGSAVVLGDIGTGTHTVEIYYSDGSREIRTATVDRDQTFLVAFTYVEKAEAPVDFVRVDGGTFQMGDTFGDGVSDEKPIHRVTVSSFFLSKYEVTVGQFRNFINETGYRTTAEKESGGVIWNGEAWERKKDASWKNPYMEQTENDPVVLVSWLDAAEYCNWLSRSEGLTSFYTIRGTSVSMNWSSNGYRLPTDAEWEYAAKGGKLSRGTKYAGSDSADAVAWYWNTSGNRTHPVGQKEANELGLYDMSGNVWEWCNDWYGERYYASRPSTDPRGPDSGQHRVLRGGSCIHEELVLDLREYSRLGFLPARADNDHGFRPARPIVQER